MRSNNIICLETCIEAYKSRLENNNLDLHMILYSCNHCFEYNPYTKEIRPFNSIFWYNLEKGINENKYQHILDFLQTKYEEAKNDYNSPIGIIVENTLAVDMNILEDNIISEKPLYYENILKEYDTLTKSIEEMYSNWKDIMMFVLNNYENIEKVSINNYWRN